MASIIIKNVIAKGNKKIIYEVELPSGERELL